MTWRVGYAAFCLFPRLASAPPLGRFFRGKGDVDIQQPWMNWVYLKAGLETEKEMGSGRRVKPRQDSEQGTKVFVCLFCFLIFSSAFLEPTNPSFVSAGVCCKARSVYSKFS